MARSCFFVMVMVCFSQYDHGPSTTVTVPWVVETDITVCCSCPLRSGGVITVPVKTVIVLTSKPAAIFSPLAESVESLPQKADASRFQKLRNTIVNISISRLMVRFLVVLTRQRNSPAGSCCNSTTGLLPAPEPRSCSGGSRPEGRCHCRGVLLNRWRSYRC